MITMAEFEAVLSNAIKMAPINLAIGLEKVGALAESLAESYPGHERSEWPPLADSTIEDKKRKGYAVPSPLKRTGDMAASYKKDVNVPELILVVGSPEKKALWQEMGTVNGGHSIPPRPVCSTALKNSLPYAHDVFGEIAVAMLMGKK